MRVQTTTDRFEHLVDSHYQQLRFNHALSPDENAARPAHHPVVVVGAGPVGLTVAIDLAQRGVPVVLLDDDDKLSGGSRAICFAKRTLEIWDRLGVGQRMVDKGVSWNVGKVYFHDELVYAFNLLADAGHRRPAFINLQQYYCEGYLCEHAAGLANLDLRWKNKVISVEQRSGQVVLTVETPAGTHRLHADHVAACDGSRSSLRDLLGLKTRGRRFHDRFLIADVRMKAEFPAERWFWFDPPFHRNQSVLLHRQPDNVWRIDFQLGADADPEDERKPERVIPRIRSLLGSNTAFELEWTSVYAFACQRMECFRHGRVIFAGDAAHGVSPFGARGANSGVQDADNLAWKLHLVLEGKAPDALLDTYAAEREFAADDNLLHSTRSTDFITPRSSVSRSFRDAVLGLAKHHPFARRLVNSGRLSEPATYRDSALSTPDRDAFTGGVMPGAPMVDAPVRVKGADDWLLAHTGGQFTGIYHCPGARPAPETLAGLEALADAAIPVTTLVVVSPGANGGLAPGIVVEDLQGLLAQRLDMRDGTYYLLRPDQHVCARWRGFDLGTTRSAVQRATCNAT